MTWCATGAQFTVSLDAFASNFARHHCTVFVFIDLCGCGVLLFGCLRAQASPAHLSSRALTRCCAQEVEVFPPVPETGDSRWLPSQSDAAVVVFASEEVAGTVGVGFQRFRFISIWPQQQFPHESSCLWPPRPAHSAPCSIAHPEGRSPRILLPASDCINYSTRLRALDPAALRFIHYHQPLQDYRLPSSRSIGVCKSC
jgi:hypothetical protein